MGGRGPDPHITTAAHQSYPFTPLIGASCTGADLEEIISSPAPTVQDKSIGSRRVSQKNVARSDMQASEGGGRPDANILPFQQRPGADKQAPNDKYAGHYILDLV